MNLLPCINSEETRHRASSSGAGNRTLDRTTARRLEERGGHGSAVAGRHHRDQTPELSWARGCSMTTVRGGESVTLGRGGVGPKRVSPLQHFGSSLSLSREDSSHSSTSDLTRRTLMPPTADTLRKSTLPGKPNYVSGTASPKLPNLVAAELNSPKLADYLETPRFVAVGGAAASSSPRAVAHAHHSKRINAADVSSYRNLRLGNFMEPRERRGEGNNDSEDEDELIPERLRRYYLETFLNVCATCESQTHLDPSSPIQQRTIE